MPENGISGLDEVSVLSWCSHSKFGLESLEFGFCLVVVQSFLSVHVEKLERTFFPGPKL